MRRTISICFFAFFLLLYTFGLFLLWKPEEQEKTEKLMAETENTEYQTAESMSVQMNYRYWIYEENGYLIVYESDGSTVFLETTIQMINLEQDLQERVRAGIGFLNESELYDFLESYSS